MVKSGQTREEVIEKNLPLVHSLSHRFIGRGVEYDDLYQAGCVGLIKAVDAFDETKGFAFSTYAVPVILGEIRRIFRDGGAVKVSRSIKELYLKIIKQRQLLEQELCREPTVCEIANKLCVSAEDVTEALCAGQAPQSLTTQTEDGVTETDLPTVSFEEGVFDRVLLESAFEKLTNEETKILKCRYYNALTQSKTAAILNMSQVQVSRAEKKILQKLRRLLA